MVYIIHMRKLSSRRRTNIGSYTSSLNPLLNLKNLTVCCRVTKVQTKIDIFSVIIQHIKMNTISFQGKLHEKHFRLIARISSNICECGNTAMCDYPVKVVTQNKKIQKLYHL